MTSIPRAIAPLVTTTISLPAAWKSATAPQMRSSTSARSTPPSSATMLDPSLTTARAMDAEPIRLTAGGGGAARSCVELEDDARDLDVVARLEAGGLERPHHAHPPQAPLDVDQRVLVVEVVPRDQAVDGVALDAEQLVVDARDLESAPRRGAEHAVLG